MAELNFSNRSHKTATLHALYRQSRCCLSVVLQFPDKRIIKINGWDKRKAWMLKYSFRIAAYHNDTSVSTVFTESPHRHETALQHCLTITPRQSKTGIKDVIIQE